MWRGAPSMRRQCRGRNAGRGMPERSFAPWRYRRARPRRPREREGRRWFRSLPGSGASSTRSWRLEPSESWSLSGFLAYAAFTLPLSPAASAELPSSAVIYATDAGEPSRSAASIGAIRSRPTSLPPYLAKAVVAIEDRRFYEHAGIDPRGIARAAFNNVIGSRHRGRQHDHAAARARSLSVAGAVASPEGAGSDARAVA